MRVRSGSKGQGRLGLLVSGTGYAVARLEDLGPGIRKLFWRLNSVAVIRLLHLDVAGIHYPLVLKSL